ncbi:MAG: ribonuclease HI [Desulfuromonadales bacterium]|nr:ribonuclease HI [Desulfuromonadales bacterium]
MKSSPQLYLLDGSSYIYRAYYGIRDLATSDGMPTNAVFGFTKMLLDLLQENCPDYLAVVFDRPREETFRRKIYPEYKANRDAMPEDLVSQIPYIKKILQALNIPDLEAPEFEADDVIATLARRYAAEGIQVTVVTGDKDLMQIVDDRIDLLDTMKNKHLGKNKRSGPQEVLDRFGVPAELVPDVLGLAGDTSDNIPGVPGIGEKTAAELIRRFGSMEDVLKWKHLVSGKKRKENLHAYADQARLSKTLATLRYDVDLEAPLASLTRQAPDLSVLMPLLRELEFESLAIAFTPPAPGVVELYTDGSCGKPGDGSCGKPGDVSCEEPGAGPGRGSGPGGYGVILRYGEHEKELSGFDPTATSQRMELLAAIKGLEALHNPSNVHVFSDSQYLVQGMSKWIHNWTRNGRLQDPDALANQDLWQQISALSHKHEITWEWIRGHAGHPFNERCDKLAKRAAEDGMRATEELNKSEETIKEVETVTVPFEPANQEPLPAREDVDFDSDDDGQLRLC